MARAQSRIQVVDAVPHYKPCPKATAPDEVVVCAKQDRADTYKLERDHSPFGGQFKGMTLGEIGDKTAENMWGEKLRHDKSFKDPEVVARKMFEDADPRTSIPGGNYDSLGRRDGKPTKQTLETNRDNRE